MVRRFSAGVRAWVFDALIGAGVAGLTGLGIFMRETPRETMLLGYIMAVAVLFRRRHPLIAMAVISLAALGQVIFFPPEFDPLPYDLAVLVGMFSVVKYGRRIAGGFVAAVVVAIGIVIEVWRHFENDWWALALWYLGVCGGVWLMAYTMRTRRLYVASLEERAATLEREREHLARIAVADERASIARELHDVVAHSLAVMIVQADGGRYAIEADPQRARQALETVANTGRDALEDMRRLVAVLRGDGVEEPAERRLGTLADLVHSAEAAGLSVTVTEQIAAGLSPAVELAVYRIVQESLTNVMRHAGPSASVVLSVSHECDLLTVSIVDDGGSVPGIAPQPADNGRPARPALASVLPAQQTDDRGAAWPALASASPLPQRADGRAAGPALASVAPLPQRADGRATRPALASVAPPSQRADGHGLTGMRERVNVHGGTLEAGPVGGGGWSVRACIPVPAKDKDVVTA